MTKQELKEAVLETLRKVEPVEELPAFIRVFKMQTFFRLIIGEITKEAADTILENIEAATGA